MRITLDIWLDGYDTYAEMFDACVEFVSEELNMTASSMRIVEQTYSPGEEEEYGNLLKAK